MKNSPIKKLINLVLSDWHEFFDVSTSLSAGHVYCQQSTSTFESSFISIQ
jgi:hypothetical protein